MLGRFSDPPFAEYYKDPLFYKPSYVACFSMDHFGGDMEKTCLCCKNKFIEHSRQRDQKYCSRSECRRLRKRRWQREKMAKDSAYRENQAAAQRQWCSKNKGYWREYRRKNPAYAEQNRQKQRERNRRRRSGAVIAKMDASGAQKALSPGRYRLMPLCNGGIAKMDALIVEIGIISRGYGLELQGP